MTALDDLPPEQRAVLELVLKRGRSYDEIAGLLSVDRARVRQRALAGFDALGPDTDVAPERRALITDYLLGQLPAGLSEQVAQRLAQEPADRAWARVIASELRPVASAPLPEIPTGAALDEPEERQPEAPDHPADAPASPAGAADMFSATAPRSSRLGGAILLGLGALAVVVVVVLVLVLTSGSSHGPTTTTGVAQTPTGTATTPTGTGTTGTTPKGLATVRLTPPSSSSKAQGVAEAFLQTGKIYLAVVAINLAPNSHNYYAVWLSNSPSDSRLIGFSPPVTSNGRLQAAGNLTASDSHYKKLLLTLETNIHPKQPGTTVLSGAFNLQSS
jgi:anti-sigma factor RsiW